MQQVSVLHESSKVVLKDDLFEFKQGAHNLLG